MHLFSRVCRWIALAACVGLAAAWLWQRSVAADLEARADALRQAEQQLADLQAEHARFREQQPSRPVSASIPGAVAVALEPASAAAPAVFGVGEWVGADQWTNQGNASPRETVATLLWAAAGADLGVVKRSLELDDAARTKAVAWHASLPADLRAGFPTPEDLVASVTVRDIPTTAAQVIWLNQTDDEHAIVGVYLEGATSAQSALASAEVAAGDRPPPVIPAQTTNRLALLNLQRSSDGWRIQVPPAAIDHLMRKWGDGPVPFD